MILPLTLAALVSFQGYLPPGGQAATLAQEAAALRADELTRDDGPKALQALQELVARTETELEKSPTSDALRSLLAELYSSELDGLTKRGMKRELALRLIELLERSHGEGGSKSRDALASAAGQAITGGRIRSIFGPLAAELPAAATVGEGGGTRPRAQEDIIAAAVATALATGDHESVQRLGKNAVPALVDAATKIAGPKPRHLRRDPLFVLTTMSPAEALDVALVHLANGDFLMKSRLAETFSQDLSPLKGDPASPFAFESVWELSAASETARLRNPEWAQLVLGLAEEPSLPHGLIDPHLQEFLYRGGCPSSFEPLVFDWCVRHGFSTDRLMVVPGSQDARPARWTTPRGIVRSAARYVAEWDVAQPSDDNLIAAMDILLREPDASGLFRLVEMDDYPVRERLARAFGLRSIPTLGPDGQGLSAGQHPVVDEAYLDALDWFVLSPMDAATVTAIRGVPVHRIGPGQAGSPASASVDLDVLVRWLGAAWTDRENKAAQACFDQIPRLFMGHPQPGRLVALAVVAGWWEGSRAGAVPETKLAARLISAAGRVAGVEGVLTVAGRLRDVGHGAAAIPAAARAAKQLRKAREVDMASFIAWLGGHGSYGDWLAFLSDKTADGRSLQVAGFVKDLPVADQKAIACALWRVNETPTYWLDVDDMGLGRADWLEVLRAPGLTPAGARCAIEMLVESEGPGLPPETAVDIARGIALAGESPESSSEYGDIGAPPEAIVGALLDMEDLDEAVLLDIYVRVESGDLATRLLERFPKESWAERPNSPLLSALISYLARQEDERWLPELITAVGAGSMAVSSLSETIYYQTSRVHLPVAKAILAGGDRIGQSYRSRARDYVASFLDDEALEILIDAARQTRDKEFRDSIFAEVEKMIAWQESEARWQTGRGGAATRGTAVAKLVRLLDDPTTSDVARAEALLGLGLLGAVEEIPRLIGALESESRAEREAGKDALERLRTK